MANRPSPPHNAQSAVSWKVASGLFRWARSIIQAKSCLVFSEVEEYQEHEKHTIFHQTIIATVLKLINVT